MKSLLLSSVMFLAITATQAQDLKPLRFRYRAGSDRLEPADGEVRSLFPSCRPERLLAQSQRH